MERVAHTFGISNALAKEIVWMNDDGGSYRETPEARFDRMLKWIDGNIRKPPALWFWSEA